MFDSEKTQNRFADAIDLAIDFATLGEYGLEPVTATPRPCETRHRPSTRRSTGAWNSAIARFAPQS